MNCVATSKRKMYELSNGDLQFSWGRKSIFLPATDFDQAISGENVMGIKMIPGTQGN